MTLRLQDMDYGLDSSGTLANLDGISEVLQRVLIQLTARRGSFPMMPQLGSQLYRLLRTAPADREAQAQQYVQEALAEETDLTLTNVTLTPQDGDAVHLRVELTWQGEALTAELDVI